MRSGLVGSVRYGSTMTCDGMGEGILHNLSRLSTIIMGFYRIQDQVISDDLDAR